MRNLKRALSLGLTAAMISGLMVMGSSAASYADVTSEDNQEAIEVLQAVEIMVGDENGDFNPDQNVTRNEMAVIMANLMEYNVASYKNTSPFTDVPAWAEPYVAACWTNGITAGYSDTIYGGSDTVTTAQAALMLMKALGYFQYASDFGSDWQLATTRQGNAIDLFNGVDSGVTQAMTRNDVAQLVLNTLKSGTVQASTDGSMTIGNITINKDVNYSYITSNQPYATAIDDARSTSNTTDAGKSIVELGEQLYMGDLKLNDNTTDVFGRPARYWEYDGNEIGTYAKTELLKQSYTTEVTGKDLHDLLGSSTIKDYELTVTIDGVADDSINPAIFTAADMNKNNNHGVGDTGNGTLTEVYVDIDKHTIDIAIINTYLAKADGDYDEKKEELDIKVYGLKENNDEYVKVVDNRDNDKDDVEDFVLDGEEFDVADAVDGDAYLVTVADGEVQTAAVPEIVSDTEISAFKKNSSVTVAGTKYDYSNAAEYDYEVLDHYTSSANGQNLKDVTYNVYLDNYGYAIGVDLVETPNNYVFITGADAGYSNLANKTREASAIFLDGTMDVIEVRTDKGDAPADDALVNTWYTYTVNNNGVYTLTKVAYGIDKDEDIKVAQYHDMNYTGTIDKKNISLKGNSTDGYSRVYGNDSTVYLTASIKEISTALKESAIIIDAVDSVTTGVKNANIEVWGHKADEKAACEICKVDAKDVKDVPAIQDTPEEGDYYSNGVYTLYKDNGYIIASVVVGEDAAASKNLVYVHSSDVEQEGYDKTADEWTWTRKVISDGQEIELTEVGDSLTYLDRMDRYSWYQVKFNANNEVISVEKASDAVLGANEYVDDISELETAINAEDTVLYTEDFKHDQPTMRGSTLYVTTHTTADDGFFVAEDANIALIEFVKNKQEVTFETGVDELEDIIDDLNEKNGEFDYQISAILEDGAATSVVIYDKTNTYERPTVDPDEGESAVLATLDPDKLTGTIDVVDRVGTGETALNLAIAALEDAGYTYKYQNTNGTLVALMGDRLYTFTMNVDEAYLVELTVGDTVSEFVNRLSTDELWVREGANSTFTVYLKDGYTFNSGDKAAVDSNSTFVVDWKDVVETGDHSAVVEIKFAPGAAKADQTAEFSWTW